MIYANATFVLILEGKNGLEISCNIGVGSGGPGGTSPYNNFRSLKVLWQILNYSHI